MFRTVESARANIFGIDQVRSDFLFIAEMRSSHTRAQCSMLNAINCIIFVRTHVFVCHVNDFAIENEIEEKRVDQHILK